MAEDRDQGSTNKGRRPPIPDPCPLTPAPADKRAPTSMRALIAWTFGVKRADRVMAWSLRDSPADYLPPVSCDGVAAVARGAVLGVRVDTSLRGGEGATGVGPIALVRFRASAAGASELKILDVEAFDAAGNPVTVSARGGKVIVQ